MSATEASTQRRAALLLPWVDLAATYLTEGNAAQAEATLRVGMWTVRNITEAAA